MTPEYACHAGVWQRMLGRRQLIGLAAAGAAALGLPPRRDFVALARQDATPLAGDVITWEAPVPGAMANGSFIHPLVELFGDLEIGPNCFVAGNTILYAAEGRRHRLGAFTNCQDNAYLVAESRVLETGSMVSIAHQAVVTDSLLGDFCFLGFRARVNQAEIGTGAMVLHNTVVDGVVIPPGALVPSGARITTQADADALPPVTAYSIAFMEDVQAVNHEFAASYSEQFRAGGRTAVEGVVANPITSWLPESVLPTLGAGVGVGELAQIVGDARIGDDSRIGQRTSIRADEGAPIVIGRRARLRSRVTFHALKGSRVDVGENFSVGDETVVHGPVRIGDNVTVEDGAVVYLATVENNVIVRAGATIAGECTIAEGSIVPEGAVIVTQEDADALPRR